MERRTLLALGGVTLSAVLGGCRGTEMGPSTTTAQRPAWVADIPERPPDVNCSAASRPTPEPVDAAEALEPRDYPAPPTEPRTETAALEYVTAFERAYRQNEEMESINPDGTEDDEYLTGFDITILESWTHIQDDETAVVRLKYGGSGNTNLPTIFDYVTQFVTYYVGPSLVVRARASRYGFAGPDELSPDPWSSGEPVACLRE